MRGYMLSRSHWTRWLGCSLLGGMRLFIIKTWLPVICKRVRIFKKRDTNSKLLALLMAVDTSLTVVPCIFSPLGIFLNDTAYFREEEVVPAIRLFPTGKVPCPDGMPIEWYHQYSKALAPRLLQLYVECFQKGSLTPSFY